MSMSELGAAALGVGGLRGTVKVLAGMSLGLGFLTWVVQELGPRTVEVVVQVEDPDVEVELGGVTYEIVGQRDKPIVCELPPGWHTLVMRRGEKVLFEESFEVRPGANVVRNAHDPERVYGNASPRPIQAVPGPPQPPRRGLRSENTERRDIPAAGRFP